MRLADGRRRRFKWRGVSDGLLDWLRRLGGRRWSGWRSCRYLVRRGTGQFRGSGRLHHSSHFSVPGRPRWRRLVDFHWRSVAGQLANGRHRYGTYNRRNSLLRNHRVGGIDVNGLSGCHWRFNAGSGFYSHVDDAGRQYSATQEGEQDFRVYGPHVIVPTWS